MTDNKYETCEQCGAALVENLLTGSIYCKICGWSPQKDSEIKEPGYIG